MKKKATRRGTVCIKKKSELEQEEDEEREANCNESVRRVANKNDKQLQS